MTASLPEDKLYALTDGLRSLKVILDQQSPRLIGAILFLVLLHCGPRVRTPSMPNSA